MFVGITTTTIVLLVLSGSLDETCAQCQAPETVELTASDAFPDDNFGYSVDIDGNVAVAGAHQEGGSAGAAYVFRFDGSDWIEEEKLIGSDTADGDHFGWSVAVSGDTIVAGAHFNHHSGYSDAGSAYVFVHDGFRWSQAAKLTAHSPFMDDEFGHAVAVDGDRIIVGAWHDDDAGGNSGSAYIFEKPSGGWTDMTETAKLTASDAAASDEFGMSVSISGEVAVVGAHLKDGGDMVNSGSVYLFQYDGSAWRQVATLNVSDPVTQDRLGRSVAIDGDVVVAGAWGKDDGGNQSGAAYVYEKPAKGWTSMTETAKLTASDAATGDRLGWWVSIDGDHVVVGAPAHEWDGDHFGAAYAFWRPLGGWADMTENAKLTGSDEVENDRFALAVSVGGSRAIVGAHIHSHTGAQATGAAYIYGGLVDCQPNGVLDLCDVVLGTSTDSDGDFVPDECEAAAASIEGSLMVRKAEGDEITLAWDPSCISSDSDYEIYEGMIGVFDSHTAKFCTTGGELEKTFSPADGDTYYIVVSRNAAHEGSYGLGENDMERFPASDACLPRFIEECP
jgi:hypothetical protein